jgi:N-acetylglucosamine kinase-like BadF-type ATPase
MKRYFLGVDGGQSSTTALIGDENGWVLGYGRAGPCNHVAAPEGREKFRSAVGGSIAQAWERAGLAPASFAAACLGFSGGAADKEAMTRELLAAEQLAVTHDAMIALAGATAGDPGIIVIAGTGSIAFGRNAAGKTARAGGWGYIFGDEGGAFDIARQALRAALRQEEGWGPSSSLHARLMEASDCNSANDLMHRLYTPEWPRPRIAGLARLVDEAARDGDPVARDILHQAAADLTRIADAVREQLFEGAAPAKICPIGSVFRGAILRAQFQKLVERNPANWVVEPAHGPAAGALLEAYRLAGLRLTLTNLPAAEK